jgi:hypothetical protein
MPTLHVYAHPDIIYLVVGVLGFVMIRALLELIP